MSSFVNLDDLNRIWRQALAELLPRIESASFLIQLTAIVGTALLAFWLGPRLVRFIGRLMSATPIRPWVGSVTNVLLSVAVSGLWLLFLWIATEAGRSAGLTMTVVRDAVSLLSAWVVIRLFSHVVRNRLWSSVIFFAAFSVAALDILGLLNQLQASLDTLAFTYGSARISALNIVRALVVLAFLLWLTALLRGFLEKRIFHAESLTPSLQALFVQLLKILLPVLAILAALPVLGLDLTALTVFGGALAVGAGLGLQRTVANLISGLSLLAGGTIRPGDVIAVKDMAGAETFGRVTSIGARYVSLRTRSGIEYLMPNEYFITNGVENWSHTDTKVRLKIPFGVAYDSNPRQVIALALEAAAAVPRVVRSPPPVCLLNAFGDSSVNFEMRIWIDDPMNGVANVKSQCLLEIWDRLHAHGIRIPFPQRDLHLVSMPDGAMPPRRDDGEPKADF